MAATVPGEVKKCFCRLIYLAYTLHFYQASTYISDTTVSMLTLAKLLTFKLKTEGAHTYSSNVLAHWQTQITKRETGRDWNAVYAPHSEAFIST